MQTSSKEPVTPTKEAYVIVLHGLARSSWSMRRLAKALEQAGYRVLNLDYESRKYTVEENAEKLLHQLLEEVAPDAALHLVSHSMGGLVGRELMGRSTERNWVNAVFIAPPHQGSQVARTLSSHPATQAFYKWFYGPAGIQVAEPLALPLPPCPFGVIAGVKAGAVVNPTSWISGSIFADDTKNDGTVAVEETRLAQMLDLVEVEVDHTTIMNHPQVHALVLHFLANTGFPPPPDTADSKQES